ncbi:MAG: N-acetyl sugar amidotransferase [Ignavibacteriales bacterium]
MAIQFCKKCVMPNTRPGIVFNNEGVCSACVNYEKKQNIDWDKRWRELEELCNKYRGCNGSSYDCAVAVSGGKDSHYQVYAMKELLGMNPLLLAVDNDTWTETGRKNKENISEAFGCDVISFSANRKVSREMMKKALAELGSPTWFADAAIYAYPVRMAIKFGLKLLVYGENVNYEYGGFQREETYSAKRQRENDVVKPLDLSRWLDENISEKDLFGVIQPTYDETEAAGLEPIYLSYFVNWDSHHNYEVAKRYGFRHMEHEWQREGTIEQYNQIDSPAYLINQWFKYPKFGHASVTEMASRWIRAGLMSREEAIPLVKARDHKLDQNILDSFLDFTRMTAREFWSIADKWYNRDLFYQERDGIWKPKFQVD